MILISNHLLSLPEFKLPNDAVIRINLAWIPTVEALDKALATAQTGWHSVFLDYPRGRRKPPTPAIPLAEAVRMAREYAIVGYFAVSNVESADIVYLLRETLPERIALVPKIETETGVANLRSIVDAAKAKHIMLDTEDLYADLLHSRGADGGAAYLAAVNDVYAKCRSFNVEVLKLYGVVFSEA